MSVFADLRNGKAYDIRDSKYRQEVWAEIMRCRHLCHKINAADPYETGRITELEKELFNGNLPEGSFSENFEQRSLRFCEKELEARKKGAYSSWLKF